MRMITLIKLFNERLVVIKRKLTCKALSRDEETLRYRDAIKLAFFRVPPIVRKNFCRKPLNADNVLTLLDH